MQYYGYAGKILYVDLTSGQARTEPLDMEMAEKFIGGWGIGERLLYDILKPGKRKRRVGGYSQRVFK